jgi:hypothetical protein
MGGRDAQLTRFFSRLASSATCRELLSLTHDVELVLGAKTSNLEPFRVFRGFPLSVFLVRPGEITVGPAK